MAKLYFKWGAMNSSKTAQVIMTKFNYEERGMKVMLIKPSTDDRDGADIVKSRMGLEAKAKVVTPECNIYKLFEDEYKDFQVIICDEAQFLTEDQVDQLADLTIDYNVPVLCFGLRTDFQTHFFPGSKRLMEVAESITELKTICECGAKATINARLDDEGNVVFEGDQVVLGGNDRYKAMCRKCWTEAKRKRLGK